ncbi:MAG: PadR family transcriptional regulator [Dehalococcoidales bacterium]
MFRRPFFPFPPHQRIFEKGDLKYIILNLVKDKPSHGYEIMRALEGSFHGFYTPSAGSVYPTLQMLEDMGYVSSSERDGKKVYTITEEGKKFLTERQDVIAKIKEQMKDWSGPHSHQDFHDAMQELGGLWQLIGRRTFRPGTEKWPRIKEVLARARQEIEDIIGKD